MSNIVKINGTDVQVLEYEGQRVATLAQVDVVHGRPDGTAPRNFNRNKKRLVEGEDYRKFSADEFRSRFPGVLPERTTEDVTIVFESGYLMLVKSFKDDLAWQVQRQLVNGYFRASAPQKLTAVRQTPLAAAVADSVAAIILIGDAVAKVPGVKPGIAMAATLSCIQQNTGIETASMRRVLPAANEGPQCALNATNLGKLAGLSPVATNKRLQQLGLQVKNARGEWELTEAGSAWAEALPYSADTGHSGYQVLWNPAVASKLREARLTFLEKQPKAVFFEGVLPQPPT